MIEHERNKITYLDTSGLECPQPLLQLKLLINTLKDGQIVEILTTDPHADLDFTIWCERYNHSILKKEIHNNNQGTIFQIKKSKSENG